MKRVVMGIVLLGVIVGGFWYLQSQKKQAQTEIAVTYVSESGTELPVVFNTKERTVTVTLPELGEVVLAQTVSASGARYANEDESIVVWEKGGEITITIQDEVVYQGLVIEEVSTKNDGDDVSDSENSTPKNDDATAEQETGSTERSLLGEWVWEKTHMNDDTVHTPSTVGKFGLTLSKDGTVFGTTDCNNFSGTFTAQDGVIEFSPLASTLMYCEGSSESKFMQGVSESTRYMITDEGNLVLMIAYDSGSVIFTKKN